ncbi:MAG: GIY-YIG nuclease family protein [Candidatus Udaeobacter sp.]
MSDFFYVYILVTQLNESGHYTGITRDLEQRFLDHNRGICLNTCKTGRGESKPRLLLSSKVKPARLKNI